jgi:hypothetical protein
MKTKKIINIDQEVVNKLMAKYPGVPFNKLVERSLDKLIGEDPTEAPSHNDQVKLLIQDYNKLKTSYRQFKDEVDNRLIILETRLG